MGAKTNIQWTGSSWNPIAAYLKRDIVVGGRTFKKGTRGWFCSKVSPGCANCYAEGINMRLGNGLAYVRVNLADIEWRIVGLDAPLRWTKARRIFVCSMCDLFHASIPVAMIDQVFAVIALAQRHTFQVLTKRSDRMREYMSAPDLKARLAWRMGAITALGVGKFRTNRTFIEEGGRIVSGITDGTLWPLPNLWLGTSAEDQQRFDERFEDLIQTPAAVTFVSAEPLLGPIDIVGTWQRVSNKLRDQQIVSPRPVREVDRDEALKALHYVLQWLIVGGESGRGARPCNVQWIRDIIEQCKAAGVAVFVKQLGSEPGFALEDEERRGNGAPSFHHSRELPGSRGG
jgi:protein gp37